MLAHDGSATDLRSVSRNPSIPCYLNSAPSYHKRFEWPGGSFEMARRENTESVEGSIKSTGHLVMATLSGGARRHEYATDDGFRYSGRDRAGFVSFLPAGCERRLKLSDVAWEWAAIALRPDSRFPLEHVRSFSRDSEPFLFGMLMQLRRLLTDGRLDATYCDAMALALKHYLWRKQSEVEPKGVLWLTPRQLLTIADLVQSTLAEEIRIADLARAIGLSEGHFHRAFRSATGKTPLRYIQEQRVERAAEILKTGPIGIINVASKVGFQSASHFARAFRQIIGVNPGQYRRLF